ncbi:pseudouridine synthase [Alkalicoccus urumqiensis]|uniref:Pseudouridine synthase n=1 Tax=Alkalicoccus urumqiensis TaxID=1548213 RepID=A0A2P6MGH0_ALKUR|nr:pseudouridine synthase [Alkalicoccus urumqiensis]PRO65379.1 16S rRNA pseudouridine(516) synthase [Alkalicoccus urumqiensis]
MRADKLMSDLGYGSRKEVKELLKKGVLKKEGEAVTLGKTQVDPERDEILLYGEELVYRTHLYAMMNKPKGVISATEDGKEKTVIDLLEPEDQQFAPFPAGRLDKNTTGLVFLTNDGKLAHQLTSPRRKVGKEYIVSLHRPFTEEMKNILEAGVLLEDGTETMPAHITETEDPHVIHMEIYEGKYHQVKRMIAACRNHVTGLKRIRIGPLVLDESLAEGEYRELLEEEIEALKNET